MSQIQVSKPSRAHLYKVACFQNPEGQGLVVVVFLSGISRIHLKAYSCFFSHFSDTKLVINTQGHQVKKLTRQEVPHMFHSLAIIGKKIFFIKIKCKRALCPDKHIYVL